MKSLNDVIGKMEKFFVCPCADEANEYCDLMEVQKEALQYLKAYKDDKDDLTALRAFWAEQQANPALTWDELKQMEGKPVWVEHKHYNKWLIVYEVYENTIVLDGNGFYTQYFSDDNEKEIRWQAYRKVR